MKIHNLKLYYFTPALLAGIFLVSVISQGINTQPLFSSLDDFVLFVSEELNLEKETQVSSGDLGSNKEINIDKDTIVNGNLFADKITLDKNAQINGNVSYNNLKTQKDVQILGTQTKPVSLPIALLPDIPDFAVGTQDLKFQGQDNTLTPGNYRDITLEKNSRLILSGGTYNLRKLELKDNSTLIFNAPTILNIQFKLKGQNKIAILPGQNLNPQDLIINYIGINPKQEKEDDDEEINNLLDDKEKKDRQERKIGRPIVFGKNSFLNFRLLAPKASIHIGEESTLRGNVWGRKVRVGKETMLSIQITGTKIAKPADIITDPDGGVYPINIILVVLASDSDFNDAFKVAEVVNGRIVGVVNSINLYQIETATASIADLENLIINLRSRTDLKIEGVFRDFLMPEMKTQY